MKNIQIQVGPPPSFFKSNIGRPFKTWQSVPHDLRHAGNVTISDFSLFAEPDSYVPEWQEYEELVQWLKSNYIGFLPSMDVNVFWLFVPSSKSPMHFSYLRISELETAEGQFNFSYPRKTK